LVPKRTQAMGISNSILTTTEVATAISVLDLPLRDGQIPEFRRLINSFVGARNDLFHNHVAERAYHYRYPLVQYKTIGKKAAIMGITEPGVSALHDLMTDAPFREQCQLLLGEQFALSATARETLLLSAVAEETYRIRKYLPFNPDNLTKWNSSPSLVARATLLESCLTGHLLKFASALRWQLPPRSLEVVLLDFRPYQTKVHGASFLAFELEFKTNMTLPEQVGLGKAVSHGFGVCTSF
jgi:hypothetical protein